jgi:hypothetical protein
MRQRLLVVCAAGCLQTGDLHIQVAESSVMLGALFSGLTVYPHGAQQQAGRQAMHQHRTVCLHVLPALCSRGR